MKMAAGSPVSAREKNLLVGGAATLLLVCLLGGGAIYSAGALRAASTPPPTQAESSGTMSETPGFGTGTRPTRTSPPARLPFIVQVVAYIEKDGNRVPGWKGSGILLSKDGLILTSDAIARPGKPFTVSDLIVSMPESQGKPAQPAYYAEVVQSNSALDLAVLRIVRDIKNNPVDRAALNLPFAVLGNSDYLQAGSAVTMFGFGPEEGALLKNTRVEVASFRASPGVSQRAFAMLSTSLQGSFDGGAVVDENGELVGIATGSAFDGEGQAADCRPLYDSNRDGKRDVRDRCTPGLLKISAFRPLRLAKPLIDAANRGETNILRDRAQLVELPLSGKLLFGDNFLNTTNGWPEADSAGILARTDNDRYRVDIADPFKPFAAGIAKPFGDVRIEATARVESPTGTGDFGVLCRYVDENNFYALEISEDGYYSIWKRIHGVDTPLVDWSESDALQSRDPSVRLTATCIGENLSLILGEKMLGQAADKDLKEGGVGIAAGSWEKGGFAVSFDDLTVRSAGNQPERPLEVLFRDDFSDPLSGWLDNMGAKYFNNGLRLFVQRRMAEIWSRPQKSFLNVRLEVDGTKLGGPDDNDFGLICRYQEGTKEFYIFHITSDGKAGIGYFTGTQVIYLTGNGKLSPASAVLRGEATNHLRADCAGPTLTFFVNGTQVLEVEDSRLADEGDVGVTAGTWSTAGADILFDNFVVYKP